MKLYAVEVEYNKNLFGVIDRFVQVEILGVSREVPDRLELLRVFQYLDFYIDYARLCWNGSCERCYVEVEKDGKKLRALSCRTKSLANLKILKLPPTVRAKDPESSAE